MTLRLPRHLLFDLDGTVLDSLPGIAFSVNSACQAVGVPDFSPNLKSFLGPPIRTIFSKAIPTEDAELLDRLEEAFRASYDREGWQQSTCFDGALSTLEAMRSDGHRLFVVSNKPRHISLRILEREGVLPFFERVYTRDSRRPPYGSKEEMVREFLRENGISAADCLMVGDTIEDIAASSANEVPAALMEHGYGEVPLTAPVALRLRGFSDLLPLMALSRNEQPRK